MSATVYHCPLVTCSWSHTFDDSDCWVPETIEAVLVEHTKEHTAVEAMQTIAYLQGELKKRDDRIDELAGILESYRSGDLSTKPYGTPHPSFPGARLAGKKIPLDQLSPEARKVIQDAKDDLERRRRNG